MFFVNKQENKQKFRWFKTLTFFADNFGLGEKKFPPPIDLYFSKISQFYG